MIPKLQNCQNLWRKQGIFVIVCGICRGVDKKQISKRQKLASNNHANVAQKQSLAYVNKGGWQLPQSLVIVSTLRVFLSRHLWVGVALVFPAHQLKPWLDESVFVLLRLLLEEEVFECGCSLLGLDVRSVQGVVSQPVNLAARNFSGSNTVDPFVASAVVMETAGNQKWNLCMTFK